MIVVGQRSTSILAFHLGIRLEAKEQQTKKVGSTSDVNMKDVTNYSKDEYTSTWASTLPPKTSILNPKQLEFRKHICLFQLGELWVPFAIHSQGCFIPEFFKLRISSRGFFPMEGLELYMYIYIYTSNIIESLGQKNAANI